MATMWELMFRIATVMVVFQVVLGLEDSSCPSARKEEASAASAGTAGLALLQRTGAVEKKAAPREEAEGSLTELKRASKAAEERPKKALDNFDFENSENNNNDPSLNKEPLDAINNDPEVKKDASKGATALSNEGFDFGDGPIKADPAVNARAAAEGLRLKVEKVVKRASSALKDAADSEQAIREALDKIVKSANPTAEELKEASELVQKRLNEAQGSFQEAQRQLLDLKETSSGDDSAARADCVPRAWLLICAICSWCLLAGWVLDIL